MALAVLFLAALAFNAVASIPSPLQVIDSPMECDQDGARGYCSTVEDCLHFNTNDQPSSQPHTCRRFGMVCCTQPIAERHIVAVETPTSEDEAEPPVGRGYNDMCQTKNNLTTFPSAECCGREASFGEQTLDENRIFYGKQAKSRQFPWMVRIFNGKMSTCSGVLIGSRHVLTADHCDQPSETRNYIGLGCGADETRPMKCEMRIEIAMRHRQEDKDGWPRPDIAILELLTPAPYTDTIRPICLPRASAAARLVQREEKTLYAVAGWGLTESNQKSRLKMYTVVPHVPSDECEKTVQEICSKDEGNRQICSQFERVKLEGRICAGGKKRDTCAGDSGGPLMRITGNRFEAVGITTSQTKRKTSSEYSCGQGEPNLYLDVRTHMNWITETLVN